MVKVIDIILDDKRRKKLDVILKSNRVLVVRQKHIEK